MGFHFYTDGFWQKHAVTTEATVVDAKRGKQGGDSWMHMYWWTLLADVTDPKTGQIVRAEATTLTNNVFRPGQRIKVRWSAKRKTFDLYTRSTVPEDEWEADLLPPAEALSDVGGAQLSGAELSPDQALRVQQVLGALGIGATADVQVVRNEGTGDGRADPIAQLERLAELRRSGILTDAEFEQQKQRILDKQ